MFSKIRRILGNIKVVQTDSEIVITGLPADVIQYDISKIWKTSRINAHMFSQVSRNSLSFPLFFATDVYYMLDTMTQSRSLRTNVRTLRKLMTLLLSETWLQDTQLTPSPRVNLSKIKNMIYTPKDYQQKFLETYDELTQQYQLRGYLLSAAAGSGKTYQSLVLAECLGSDLIVVICPKNAIDRVWRHEVNTLYKKPPTYWVYTDGKPYRGERVVIAHYEAIRHVLQMVSKFKAASPMVVLDESHNMNETGSTRTQLFIELCDGLNARDVIWASGTPIKAMGGEAIPLLTTIDPFFTEDVKGRFKRIYGRDGNRGVDILRHRMGLISYKVEKHQLGLDKPIMKRLPVTIPNGKDYTLTAIRKDMQDFILERFKYYKTREKEDTVFYKQCVDLRKTQATSSSDKLEHSQYERDVKAIRAAGGDARQVGDAIVRSNQYEKHRILPGLPKEQRARFKDVKSIYKYLNLKIQGEALGRILGRKRIDCHVDMVPHIDFKGVCNSTVKKTVVFTSFVDALEATHRHLTERGMNPVAVYGKTNSELARSVSMFGNQEDLNPLIATYQSLSTAVPLVMADTMLMINSPFRAYIHEQAVSRIHRLGADTQTVVWEAHLDTGDEPNISTRSGDILEWSQKQVEAIMGIKSPFDIEETDTTLTISSEMYGLGEKHTLPEGSGFPTLPSYVMDW